MAELCFNLWYYLTPQQTISGISARAYMLDGSEDEIGEMLTSLSEWDFLAVPVRQLPTAVERHFRGRGVPYSALVELGVEAVFEGLFAEIRGAVHPSVPFPEDKLFFATPLYDFGEGFRPAQIGDGVIRSR